MRYDVGRFRRPMRRSTEGQLVSLIALGDGSTLTLDFTTGILDSRLTFTRLSTATFINSSGFVEQANVNLFRNTVWTSTTLPSGWLENPSNTGTIVYNGDGTISCSATSETAWIFPSFPYVPTVVGLSYICSVRVVSISGSAVAAAIVSSGNMTQLEYFVDGVSVSSSTPITGPCVISVRGIAPSTQWFPRLGAGVQGVNVTFDVVMSEPHTHPGYFPLPYRANTSTSVPNYNAPRFDYDPSTRAPKGLLIEGENANLLNWSESFLASGGTNNNWADTSITRTTGQADPANGTTAIRFTASAGNATVISSAAIGTSAERTFSVWLRRVSGTGDIQYTQNNGTNWTTQAITSTWTRYSFTHTVNHQVGIRIVTSGDVIEIWGAQLETGRNSSSYIPTGASQVTRSRDQVALTNLSSINFSQTEGTCLATVEVREKADSTFLPYGSFDTSGGGRCWWWLRHNLSTVSGTRLLGRAFDSGGSGVLTTANYVYNSGNGGVVKFATSLDTAASSMVFVISGGAPQTTTAAAFTLATAAQWGLNTSTDTVATALGSMWVQSFKYWPTALPSAQLQSLTL